MKEKCISFGSSGYLKDRHEWKIVKVRCNAIAIFQYRFQWGPDGSVRTVLCSRPNHRNLDLGSRQSIRERGCAVL